ncbi:hypothetical protein HCT53_06075 [Spirochaetales bacterium BR151]|uniref:Uncharacterized protein n=1 Tax=Entomospira culicis TaxID=2719989 RepID=A0A968GF99_9SPIO|nr:hypothetical protein [Entomospira culicis]NIZ69536.1 hypothetical protein [Entomospira culicis]
MHLYAIPLIHYRLKSVILSSQLAVKVKKDAILLY